MANRNKCNGIISFNKLQHNHFLTWDTAISSIVPNYLHRAEILSSVQVKSKSIKYSNSLINNKLMSITHLVKLPEKKHNWGIFTTDFPPWKHLTLYYSHPVMWLSHLPPADCLTKLKLKRPMGRCVSSGLQGRWLNSGHTDLQNKSD